jgi:hypothetical protein
VLLLSFNALPLATRSRASSQPPPAPSLTCLGLFTLYPSPLLPVLLQITVERRLYDIGSILCSVGLLERIYMKKRYALCCTAGRCICLCAVLCCDALFCSGASAAVLRRPSLCSRTSLLRLASVLAAAAS